MIEQLQQKRLKMTRRAFLEKISGIPNTIALGLLGSSMVGKALERAYVQEAKPEELSLGDQITDLQMDVKSSLAQKETLAYDMGDFFDDIAELFSEIKDGLLDVRDDTDFENRRIAKWDQLKQFGEDLPGYLDDFLDGTIDFGTLLTKIGADKLIKVANRLIAFVGGLLYRLAPEFLKKRLDKNNITSIQEFIAYMKNQVTQVLQFGEAYRTFRRDPKENQQQENLRTDKRKADVLKAIRGYDE